MADSISVKIEGLEELRAEMRRINAGVDEVVTQAEDATAIAIRARAIKSFHNGPASGRIYPTVTGRRGKPHQASAPGQAPMSDTGVLAGRTKAGSAAEIKWERDRKGALTGTDVKYGLWLEIGTAKMAPRPWLVPAVEAELPEFRKRLVAAIRRLSNGR